LFLQQKEREIRRKETNITLRLPCDVHAVLLLLLLLLLLLIMRALVLCKALTNWTGATLLVRN
jgi:hypothetical protein